MVQFKCKGHLPEKSRSLLEVQFFISIWASNYWVRPTHIMKGNLFYSHITN